MVCSLYWLKKNKRTIRIIAAKTLLKTPKKFLYVSSMLIHKKLSYTNINAIVKGRVFLLMQDIYLLSKANFWLECNYCTTSRKLLAIIKVSCTANKKPQGRTQPKTRESWRYSVVALLWSPETYYKACICI